MRWLIVALVVAVCGCGKWQSKEKTVDVTIQVYFEDYVSDDKLKKILEDFPLIKVLGTKYFEDGNYSLAVMLVPESMSLKDLHDSIQHFNGVKKVKFH